MSRSILSLTTRGKREEGRQIPNTKETIFCKINEFLVQNGVDCEEEGGCGII